MYHALSSIIFPKKYMYSFCSRDQHFIFEQKYLFVSLKSKIHSFLRPTDAFHLCKLISRNSRPIYLSKSFVPVNVISKLFKNVLFSIQSKYGVDFFILNLCPSDRKTVAFWRLQLYVAKLIAGLIVINIWVSCIMCSWYKNSKDVPDVP